MQSNTDLARPALYDLLLSLQQGTFSQFDTIEKNVTSYLLNHAHSEQDRSLLLTVLCQSPVGVLIFSRCLAVVMELPYEVINYTVRADRYSDDMAELLRPYDGCSCLGGLLLVEPSIGYQIILRRVSIMGGLTQSMLCSPLKDGVPAVLYMFASSQGLHILERFFALKALITPEVMNTTYRIPMFNNNLLTAVQILCDSQEGIGFLLAHQGLLALLNEDILDMEFTSKHGYKIHPARHLLDVGSRSLRVFHYREFLLKVSTNTFNQMYVHGESDQSSFLQDIVDKEDCLYMLDDEDIIAKISEEGINRNHQGRSVINVLCSTDEGMQLLKKYPSIMRLVNSIGLNTRISFGYMTDGLTVLSILARSTDGLALLDEVVDIENKIQSVSLDCTASGDGVSLRTLLMDDSEDRMHAFITSIAGKALMLQVRGWTMAHKHYALTFNVDSYDKDLPSNSNMRCSLTNKPMKNPVQINNTRVFYDYENIFWHLFVYRTAPNFQPMLLGENQHPDEILQPAHDWRASIDNVVNHQQGYLAAINVIEGDSPLFSEEHPNTNPVNRL